ncbi:MAG: hypothetical protein NC038_07345 [Paludibacter sp.]|nr:hypothetical protein [Bacteroidales bacterium]MCM1069784.1 hypothetical protein [Prevotella sp.]MCM1354506.1 hypothetical protein [Bacteroides sp.]MCM1443309.1 hypothetical protein [Muribaculum sp.]MCM1482433.1 hypothetical protein [Paludibacter sp.]
MARKHTKILQVIAIFTVSILCISCLDKTESHYTPRISSSLLIRNHTDTLSVSTDINTGNHVLDTLTVGDTVRFAIGFSSLGNNLLTTQATWDKTCTSLTMGPLSEVKDVMLSTSDSTACLINLPLGYNYVALPFTYIATAAGNPSLKFTAISDSKFSPAELSIVTPIKATEQ